MHWLTTATKAIFLFSITVSCENCTSSNGSLFIDRETLSRRNEAETCPAGYHLARLDDESQWKDAMVFVTKCLGFSSAVWIAGGLGFRGEGEESWMLVTPAHSNGNFLNSSLPELTSFVQNRRGKLAINFEANRRLVSLCAKNNFDQ